MDEDRVKLMKEDFITEEPLARRLKEQLDKNPITLRTFVMYTQKELNYGNATIHDIFQNDFIDINRLRIVWRGYLRAERKSVKEGKPEARISPNGTARIVKPVNIKRLPVTPMMLAVNFKNDEKSILRGCSLNEYSQYLEDIGLLRRQSEFRRYTTFLNDVDAVVLHHEIENMENKNPIPLKYSIPEIFKKPSD